MFGENIYALTGKKHEAAKKSINLYTNADGEGISSLLIAHVSPPRHQYWFCELFLFVSTRAGAFLNGRRSYLASHAFCN